MKKILTLLLVLVLCMSVFVACKNNDEPDPTPDPTPEVTYDVQAAAEVIKGMYKDEITGNKAADFTVVPQVKVGTVTYPVTWTVDTDKVTVEVSEDGKTVTINVPEKSDEDFSYKLTATITAGDGTTASVVFDLNVVKYGVNTHEEYMNAKKDDELTVEGIVVAMNSVKMGNKRNHLFLADASVDGGYYCYELDVDPVDLGIEVGMTVSVTAKMAPYSGMQELNGGTPVIVDKTIKTVEPLDITTQFAAKENLAKYVGLAVTIKGVDIGAQDLTEASSQYLYFYLGDAEGYVRTYVTDFPAGMLVAGDKATIDADHAAHFGYKADVTGILVLYGTEHPYLIPMSVTPFTNYEEVTKTPEEKVAAELAGVTLDASLSADKVIDLLLVGKYYNDVTLEWTTTDETGAAVITDGKLTLTVPDEAITVTITVKATCGEVSDTKTLTVKLSKTITALGEASAIGAAKEHNTYTAEKYIVGGIIVEVSADKYGNMTIKDEDGNTLYVYGTYIDGTRYGEFEGDKPVVGDYVVIIGVLGQYNSKAQMKNGDITSFVHAGSIKDAVDAGAAQEHNTYTENKFLVTGVIESIASDKYGNLTIKDAEGNSIYVYGLYNQTGVRYDALTVKPVVGDTITILGVAGKYYDTVQLKNATLVAHTAATTEEPECEHTYENGVCTKCGEADPDYVAPEQPTPSGEMTITEALAAADGTNVVVRGIVCSVSEWNTQYNNNNVTIKDANGNTLYAYRLGTKVALGDEIVITGTMDTYNEARQIAQGATAEIVTVHGDNHVYVNGACSFCGAVEVVAGSTTVSKTHNDMATIAGVTVGQNTGVVNGTAIALDDKITVQFDQAGAGTAPCIYASGVRLYQNGATLTISANGATMTTIVITTADNYTGGSVLTVTGGTVSSSGGILTITVDDGATEVVIKTGADKANRLYVANIEVVYTAN